MKIKTLLLSVACAAVMVGANIDEAAARPHQHHHTHHAKRHRDAHKHQYVVSDRVVKQEEPKSLISLFTSNAIVAEARKYLGDGPVFGRKSLWCARFMNYVLEKVGYKGTGSDQASSFYHYGHRISGPKVGAIAVMHRRGGGHVGVVSGIDKQGNPIIISGTHSNRVREATYSRSRNITYVVPNG